MKKIWIAVVLLIISAGICTYEQIYIEDFCDKMVYMTEHEDADGIKKLWDKKNDTIYIFSEHDMVDDLAVSIEQLNSKNGEKQKEALAEIRALTYAYHENLGLHFQTFFSAIKNRKQSFAVFVSSN